MQQFKHKRQAGRWSRLKESGLKNYKTQYEVPIPCRVEKLQGGSNGVGGMRMRGDSSVVLKDERGICHQIHLFLV